jgi:FAD dependent oxidoreductase
MATGHAAGVAAALAAKRKARVRQLPISEIQRELLRQGASLRTDLPVVETMTKALQRGLR